MAFGLRPWLVVVALGCGAAFVAFGPRPSERQRWSRTRTPPSESMRLRTEVFRAHDLLTRVELRDSLLPIVRAASEASGGPASLVDGALEPEARARLQAILEESLRPLRGAQNADRVAVAIVVDTVPRVEGAPKKSIDELVYFLPEATDGRTCLAVLVVRGSRLRRRIGDEYLRPVLLARGGALGPCAYYLAFGEPGSGVRQWLEDSHYTHAMYPEWPYRPGARTGRLAYWSGRLADLSGANLVSYVPRLAACAAGNTFACPTVQWAGERGWGWSSQGPPGAYSIFTWDIPFETAQRFYLSDLIADVGGERFARFWSSDLEVEEAFQAELGVSMSDWTVRWAQAQLGERWHLSRPSPSARSSALWLLVVLACLGASSLQATRRQTS